LSNRHPLRFAGAGAFFPDEERPLKPIARVIEDHAATLLAIDGVAGVYEGTLPDGRVCIHVAVAARSPDLARQLPAEIDGYPVSIVETGPIGPLR
jgi:hypothetical protein